MLFRSKRPCRVVAHRAAQRPHLGVVAGVEQSGCQQQVPARVVVAAEFDRKVVAIDPTNVDASTDLGVSYYYSNRADDALKQFEVSLKQNPKHTKTLLNKGIVLAFGKQDLDGAAALWAQVVELAPGSPEAEAAKRGIDGINASRNGAKPGS